MNILELPEEIHEKIISNLQKKDLKNLSNVCTKFNKISKKFLSAEMLRECLENNWIYTWDFQNIFEPKRKFRNYSRKERKLFYVSKSSCLLDGLNLG